MSDSLFVSYEVLSPWAEADPVPLRGLSPRLDTLDGKKVGLLCNNKRSAPIILEVTERILHERFPSIETSWFHAKSFSVSALEPQRQAEFDDWILAHDAVLAAVGD